ncbi:hypothetical protein [Salmonella phage SD-13_S19]|nr:hypothetical protein [Salmonella phage SD-11_S17]WPK20276.1 hypothetical protein [Salmonella phage SD-12_S18]WPK20361.1 hypothetical protein [Salmonella phage SD-13_S19]WPK20451.1 hypothetical protein [Salmonella phage SD-14_S20]
MSSVAAHNPIEPRHGEYIPQDTHFNLNKTSPLLLRASDLNGFPHEQ